MQNQTGCKINVSPASGRDITREIGLIGTRHSIDAAKRAIMSKVDAVVRLLVLYKLLPLLTMYRMLVIVLKEDVILVTTTQEVTLHKRNLDTLQLECHQHHNQELLLHKQLVEPIFTQPTVVIRTILLCGTKPWLLNNNKEVKVSSDKSTA